LVVGEREKTPSKYNRWFEELRAKLEGRSFTPSRERPPPEGTNDGRTPSHEERVCEVYFSSHSLLIPNLFYFYFFPLLSFPFGFLFLSFFTIPFKRLKQQLDEATANNAQLTQAVRDAEVAQRAAGDQQEWFDDLRAQLSDLRRKYE
jgi:hypothetical protein